MKNIILLCAAGMSTSMLVQRMKEAAQAERFECTIEAHPIAEAEQIKDIADIILLGPQVRFQANKIRKECPDVLVDTIQSADYGQMNGKAVLQFAKEKMGV